MPVLYLKIKSKSSVRGNERPLRFRRFVNSYSKLKTVSITLNFKYNCIMK